MTEVDSTMKREENARGHSRERDTIKLLGFSSSQFSVCNWYKCIEQYHQSNKIRERVTVKSFTAFEIDLVSELFAREDPDFFELKLLILSQ